MNEKTKVSSLTLFEHMEAAVLKDGMVNRDALRVLAPGMTERQFGLAWSACRKMLRHEKGIFLSPVRGQRGVYKVASHEKVSEKVMDGDRRKIVRASEERGANLRGAQMQPGISESDRMRLNTEELLHNRHHMMVERMFLKRQKPAGCE